MLSEDHHKIYSRYWNDIKRGIQAIPGMTSYADGIGNFGYDYFGYEIGGYTDDDDAFELYTRWDKNMQDGKLKYKWEHGDKIVGYDPKYLQMRDGMFVISAEEFLDLVRESVAAFKKQHPVVTPSEKWMRVRPECVDNDNKPVFVVFEGVDNSGKTTISKKVAEYFPEMEWRKEPNFTTEEADRLNSDEFKGKDAKREVFFLEGRLANQKIYRDYPVILDRYLWSGMAYAKAFSPSISEFCNELYGNFNIFRKPSITFFMETPLETCYDREPKLKEEPGRLENIRSAYEATKDRVGCDVVTIDGTMSIEDCVKFVVDTLLERFPNMIYYTKENSLYG